MDDIEEGHLNFCKFKEQDGHVFQTQAPHNTIHLEIIEETYQR